MKVCTKCKKEKDSSEFYPDQRLKSGIASSCKDCHAKKREKQRESGYIKFYHIKRRYGVTEEEYNSLLESQDGSCALCDSKIESYFGTDKLVVDHCHTTGKVRGLLCSACNLLLGHIEKRGGTAFLEAASKYLQVLTDKDNYKKSNKINQNLN